MLGGLGDETEILSPFQCDYGYQIEIGSRSFINFSAVILDSAPVRIGDDVQIGPGVQLVTPTHPLDPDERRTRIEFAAPITICDDVWLAAGVIVCPGVTIGAATVVGAGSVVTTDLPPRHLCFGTPCRPVRESVVLTFLRARAFDCHEYANNIQSWRSRPGPSARLGHAR